MFDPTTPSPAQVSRVAGRWRVVQWSAVAALTVAYVAESSWLAVPALAAVVAATTQRAQRLGWLAAVTHAQRLGWPAGPEHEQETRDE